MDQQLVVLCSRVVKKIHSHFIVPSSHVGMRSALLKGFDSLTWCCSGAVILGSLHYDTPQVSGICLTLHPCTICLLWLILIDTLGLICTEREVCLSLLLCVYFSWYFSHTALWSVLYRFLLVCIYVHIFCSLIDLRVTFSSLFSLIFGVSLRLCLWLILICVSGVFHTHFSSILHTVLLQCVDLTLCARMIGIKLLSIRVVLVRGWGDA